MKWFLPVSVLAYIGFMVSLFWAPARHVTCLATGAAQMTRAQGLEWLELTYKLGYRDGYDEQPALSRRKVAKQIIGPVFGVSDADCLIAVYRLGFSVGDEQRLAEVEE